MQFRFFLQHVSVGFLLSLGLSACDSYHPDSMKTSNQAQPTSDESSIPVMLDAE